MNNLILQSSHTAFGISLASDGIATLYRNRGDRERSISFAKGYGVAKADKSEIIMSRIS
ncbi:MAG: hypothetical protein PHX30_05940 [Candidatus Pacebacteria bacterium]|nr:hypothetical protein [Candidatus Paceibacterota bacterium]